MRKVGFVFLIGAFLLLFATSRPEAFHSGGVAECGGCHSMHAPTSSSFLLVGTDSSSACLTCHQHAGDTGPSSYHVSTADGDLVIGAAPKQRPPGGDFAWLKKTYGYSPRSGTNVTELGERHGHNIVAADPGYVVDSTYTTAPGGTFLSNKLGCTSCHDPHGRLRRKSDGSYATSASLGQKADPIIASGSYNNSATPAAGQAVGVYRLLRGLGDKSPDGGAMFTGVAIAIAPSSYNRTELSTQTRVAYGAAGTNTWGNWCASCHSEMHSNSGHGPVHPVDQNLGSAVAGIYNAYVKSGDLSGVSTASYTSLVPFAENTGDIATLQSHAKIDNSYLNGPSASDKVMCLSCHRAHASGFPSMLRFGMENEFMVVNGTYTAVAGSSGLGRSETEMAGAYYDRPATVFATHQRALCNKCHAKD